MLSPVGVSCVYCVTYYGGLGFLLFLFLFFPLGCWEFLFGVVYTTLMSDLLEGVGVDFVGILDAVAELLGCLE